MYGKNSVSDFLGVTLLIPDKDDIERDAVADAWTKNGGELLRIAKFWNPPPLCKNWLFADTTRGAKASAIVYSMIESAKANQLNPYMYLVYLLSKLPGLKELTQESLTPYLPWSPELPSWCHKDSIKAPQD
jgi:hypothetical protein